jgi:hypothetical protein
VPFSHETTSHNNPTPATPPEAAEAAASSPSSSTSSTGAPTTATGAKSYSRAYPQFFEAYSAELNLSVIAIRGTDVGRIADLMLVIPSDHDAVDFLSEFRI